MTEAEWLACDDPAAMLELVSGAQRLDAPGVVWHGGVSDRKLRLFACALRERCKCSPVKGGDEDWYSAITDGSFDWIAKSCAAVKQSPDLLRDIFGNPFRPVTLCGGAVFACGFCGGSGKAYKVDAVGGGKPPLNPREVDCMCCGGSGTQTHATEEPCSKCKELCTETVVSLAQDIYENRDFASMPVLADALEEAGCTDAGILEHCRVRITRRKVEHFRRTKPPGACPFCGGQQREQGQYNACNRCMALYRAGETWWEIVEEPVAHVRGCWVVDLILGKS